MYSYLIFSSYVCVCQTKQHAVLDYMYTNWINLLERNELFFKLELAQSVGREIQVYNTHTHTHYV